MKLVIGYVDSWQVRPKSKVHVGHRKAVVEVKNMLAWLKTKRAEFYADKNKKEEDKAMISYLTTELEKELE